MSFQNGLVIPQSREFLAYAKGDTDANGPVMQRCHQHHWEFMIVLKDRDLSTVWEEYNALHALQPNYLHRHWGRRRQRFAWVNAIDYAFDQRGRGRRHLSRPMRAGRPVRASGLPLPNRSGHQGQGHLNFHAFLSDRCKWAPTRQHIPR